MIGKSLDQYEILQDLEERPWGHIHLAQDIHERAPVALLMLRPHWTASIETRRQFLEEARMLVDLIAPGELRIHREFDWQGGVGVALAYDNSEALHRYLATFHGPIGPSLDELPPESNANIRIFSIVSIVLMVVMGGFFIFSALSIIVTVSMTPQLEGANTEGMNVLILSTMLCLGIGIVALMMVVAGIGMLKRKKWARAIALVGQFVFIATGFLFLIASAGIMMGPHRPTDSLYSLIAFLVGIAFLGYSIWGLVTLLSKRAKAYLVR